VAKADYPKGNAHQFNNGGLDSLWISLTNIQLEVRSCINLLY